MKADYRDMERTPLKAIAMSEIRQINFIPLIDF
jgi:hypothetical protein